MCYVREADSKMKQEEKLHVVLREGKGREGKVGKKYSNRHLVVPRRQHGAGSVDREASIWQSLECKHQYTATDTEGGSLPLP